MCLKSAGCFSLLELVRWALCGRQVLTPQATADMQMQHQTPLITLPYYNTIITVSILYKYLACPLNADLGARLTYPLRGKEVYNALVKGTVI